MSPAEKMMGELSYNLEQIIFHEKGKDPKYLETCDYCEKLIEIVYRDDCMKLCDECNNFIELFSFEKKVVPWNKTHDIILLDLVGKIMRDPSLLGSKSKIDEVIFEENRQKFPKNILVRGSDNLNELLELRKSTIIETFGNASLMIFHLLLYGNKFWMGYHNKLGNISFIQIIDKLTDMPEHFKVVFISKLCSYLGGIDKCSPQMKIGKCHHN